MPRRGWFASPRGPDARTPKHEPSDAEGRPSALRRVGRGVSLCLGCLLLAAGTASAILHAFPKVQLAHRYTVMAAAFVPYGLVAFGGAAILLATAAPSRRWAGPLALAAVAGLVLQAWWAKPYWPSSPSGHGSVTVLTMNMRCSTAGMADLAALAERLQPGVVVVQDIDWKHRDRLGDAWDSLLPHATFHRAAGATTCGTAVFSKAPLTEMQSPSPQPVMEVGGDTPFLLLPVNMQTPSKGVAAWLEDFQDLTVAVEGHMGTPLVAAGDFNAVREHAPMRTLTAATGLRDAAELAGNGWTPTFPSASWHPPLIGLDHVLVSDGMVASDVQTHAIPGQEHRALSVRIGFAT